MKLVIFGASGKVGRALVEQALAQGHEVTALARNAAALSHWGARIRVVEGDARDPEAVRRALEGQEAAVVALGKPLFNREGLRAKATQAIVAAMQAAGPRRLVVLSSAGVGDSAALLPALYRWVIVPLLFRATFADHAAQEEIVRQSGLDWVIARPVNMGDGPATGQYRADLPQTLAGRKMKLARADVADFLLRQVSERDFLHQAPVLTG
jgi:uncharacterized protein YbjT (DUF2867 family)